LMLMTFDFCCMLQCVAVCCSVLQCVTTCNALFASSPAVAFFFFPRCLN